MSLDLRSFSNQHLGEYRGALNRIGIEAETWLFFREQGGVNPSQIIPHLRVAWETPGAQADVRCDLCEEQALANQRKILLDHVAGLQLSQVASHAIRCPACGSYLSAPASDPDPLWTATSHPPPFLSLEIAFSCPGALPTPTGLTWIWQGAPSLQLLVRGRSYARLGKGNLVVVRRDDAEHARYRVPGAIASKTQGSALEHTLPVALPEPDEGELHLSAELVADAMGRWDSLHCAQLTLRSGSVRVSMAGLNFGGETVTFVRLSLLDAGKEGELPESVRREVRIHGEDGVPLGPDQGVDEGRSGGHWYAWKAALRPEDIVEGLSLGGAGERRPRVEIAGHRSVQAGRWMVDVVDQATGARTRVNSPDGTVYVGHRLGPESRILLRATPLPEGLLLSPETLHRAELITLAEQVRVSASGKASVALGGKTFQIIGRRHLEIRLFPEQFDPNTQQLEATTIYRPAGVVDGTMEPLAIWLQAGAWREALVHVLAKDLAGGAETQVEIERVEGAIGLSASVKGLGLLRLAAQDPTRPLGEGAQRLELHCRLDGARVILPLAVEIRPPAPVTVLPAGRGRVAQPCYSFPLQKDASGHFNLYDALASADRDRVARSFRAQFKAAAVQKMADLQGDELESYVKSWFGSERKTASAAWGEVLFTITGATAPAMAPPGKGAMVRTASGKEFGLIADASPWYRTETGWISKGTVASTHPGVEGAAEGEICQPPPTYDSVSVTNPVAIDNQVDEVDDARLRSFAMLQPADVDFPWDTIPAPRHQLVLGEDSIVPMVLANTGSERIELRYLRSLRGRVHVLEISAWDYCRQLGFLASVRARGGMLRDLPSAPHPDVRPKVASFSIEPDAAIIVLLRVRLEQKPNPGDTEIDELWFDIHGFLPAKISLRVNGRGEDPVLDKAVGAVGMDIGSGASKAMFQYRGAAAGLHRERVSAVPWAQNRTCLCPNDVDERDFFPSRMTVLAVKPLGAGRQALPRYEAAGRASIQLDPSYANGITRGAKSRVSLGGAQGGEELKLPNNEEASDQVLLAALRGQPRPRVMPALFQVKVTELFEAMVSHLTESLFESLPTLPRAVYTARPTTLSPHDTWLYHDVLGLAFERAVRSRLVQDPGWANFELLETAIEDLMPAEEFRIEDLPETCRLALEERFRDAPPEKARAAEDWLRRARRDAEPFANNRTLHARFWFCAALSALAPPTCALGRIEPEVLNQRKVRNTTRDWLLTRPESMAPGVLERFAGWVASRIPGLDCATDEPTASISGVLAAAIADQVGDPELRRVLEAIGVSARDASTKRWLSLDCGAGTNDVEIVLVESKVDSDWGDQLVEVRPLRETHSHYAGIYATNIMAWLLLVLGRMRLSDPGGPVIQNEELRDLALGGTSRTDTGYGADGGYSDIEDDPADQITNSGDQGNISFGADVSATDGGARRSASPSGDDLQERVPMDLGQPSDDLLVNRFQLVSDFLFGPKADEDNLVENLSSTRRAALHLVRAMLPDLVFHGNEATRNGFHDLAERVKLHICKDFSNPRSRPLFEEYRRWVLPGYEATFERVAAMLQPGELDPSGRADEVVVVLSGRAARDPVLTGCARRFCAARGYPLLHLGEGEGVEVVEDKYAFFPGWPGFHPVALGLLAREGVAVDHLQIAFPETLLDRIRFGLRVSFGNLEPMVFSREWPLSRAPAPLLVSRRPTMRLNIKLEVLDDRRSLPGRPHWHMDKEWAKGISLDLARDWWCAGETQEKTDPAGAKPPTHPLDFVPIAQCSAMRLWVVIAKDRSLRTYVELVIGQGAEATHWATCEEFDALKRYNLRSEFEDDQHLFWRI